MATLNSRECPYAIATGLDDTKCWNPDCPIRGCVLLAIYEVGLSRRLYGAARGDLVLDENNLPVDPKQRAIFLKMKRKQRQAPNN